MQAMAARRFLVAIVVGAAVLAWWALSGFPMVSAVCKETNRLTPGDHFRLFATALSFQRRRPYRRSQSSGYVALLFQPNSPRRDRRIAANIAKLPELLRVILFFPLPPPPSNGLPTPILVCSEIP
jgi:hypothetical protein